MKYILFIIDGIADYPVPELGERTPLEVADCPLISRLAKGGKVGTALTIPSDKPAGTDTAMLSLFRHDMSQPWGRGALEACGAGIPMDSDLEYMRSNIVSLDDRGCITSHNAYDVTGAEADSLMSALLADPGSACLLRGVGAALLRGEGFRQYMSVSGGDFTGLPEPHNMIGGPLPFPDGAWGEVLRAIRAALDDHPVNIARSEKGIPAANALWPWGRGKLPVLPSFESLYGMDGVCVSAVPLARGVATLAGLRAPLVEGATGGLDTNWRAKTDAVLDAPEEFALLHLEACDECAHAGDVRGKVEGLLIAERMTERMTSTLNARGEDFRLMFLSDHYTPLSTRGHSAEPVPFALYDSRDQAGGDLPYTESAANSSGLTTEGSQLIAMLTGRGPLPVV